MAQMLKKGVQLYTLRDMYAGMSGMEAIGAYHGMLRALKGCCDGVELAGVNMPPQRLKEMLDENELEVCGSHEGGLGKYLGNRSGLPQYLDHLVAFNREIGNDHIVLPYAGNNEFGITEGSLEADPVKMEAFVEFINCVGTELRNRDPDMEFSYHNHALEFLATVDGKRVIDYILQETKGNVLIELDVYWAEIGNQIKVQNYIRAHPSRFFAIHMKDGKGPRGEADPGKTTFTELGNGGILSRTAIICAAERTRALKWVIYEQDRDFEKNPLESVIRSLRVF